MRARLCAAALTVLVAGLLAGCGGSSTSSASTSSTSGAAPGSSTTVPSSPAVSTRAAVASAAAVAYVAGAPIPKSGYEHWLSVETKLGASGSPSHQALGFLITSAWVIGEAKARGISVSEAEVKQRYAQLVRQSYPQAGSLRKFLARSGETEADLLVRVKGELLLSRIAAQVAAGKSASRRSAVLAAFERAFRARWKALTSCLPGYVMEDCKQYHGKPEALTTTASGGAHTASGGAASGSRAARAHGSSAAHGSSGATPAARSGGEVYSTPGGFSISSPAFEPNGAIPVEYTCAGAGTSPALNWEKVPAGAAELILFVIDDTVSDSSGGIRWIVGGIDPSSTGVAAGKLPPGAIVGTNTAGKATYSPICPAPGRRDSIEIIMYALSKKIALSPGFQPAVAEHEYGSGSLAIKQPAVMYGIASRP
jgi:phosphatidylethanolamine-binding protein (PEBP) family uncharacterized protein